MSNSISINKIDNNNNFKFFCGARLYNPALNFTDNGIYIQFIKDNLVIYTRGLSLSEIRKQRLFFHCETIYDFKDAVKSLNSEGKVTLSMEKDNIFKLTLWNEILGNVITAELLFPGDDILNEEDYLLSMKEELTALPSLKEDENRQCHNIIVNEVLVSKEGLNRLGKCLKNNYDIILNEAKDELERNQNEATREPADNLSHNAKDSEKKETMNNANKDKLDHNFKEDENKEAQTCLILKSLDENFQAIQINLEHLAKNDNQYYNPELTEKINYIKILCEKLTVTEEPLKEKIRQLKNSTILGRHEDWITSLISLTNNRIATASVDKNIKIWDVNKKLMIKSFQAHSTEVWCLALLSDGCMASGSMRRTIKIWDCENDYLCKKTLIGHSCAVKSLLVLKNGNLVSASMDKQIKVWDFNNDFNCIATLGEHSHHVISLCNLNDGYFASGSADKTVKIWDDTYKYVNTIQDDHWVYGLLLLPQDYFAIASHKTIKIWKCCNNYKETELVKTLCGHDNFILSLILLDNEYILSGSADRTIKIWDIKYDYQCINTLKGHKDHVKSLMVSDNRLISVANDRTIRLWR
jgi:WD40 repeat protein